MGIRVSGLISGLDTDSIVKELVSAYSTKKDKYVKSQTKLDWKMDAWKDLNKKIVSLRTKLDNLRFSSGYSTKKTSCSDPTKATITIANNSSVSNGSQTLKIDNVAKTGNLTGAQLGTGVTNDTTLGELGLTGNGTIAVSANGKTTNIGIASDMTVRDFASRLSEAGVNANYDATNRRMYISAKDSGVANDFALVATDENGVKALKGLGIYTRSSANDGAYGAWKAYGEYNSGGSLNEDATRTKLAGILDAIKKYQGDDTISGSYTQSDDEYWAEVMKNATTDAEKAAADQERMNLREDSSIKYLQAQNAELSTKNTALSEQHDYATNYIMMKALLARGEVDPSNPSAGRVPNLSQADQDELEGLLRNSSRTDAENARMDELKTQLGDDATWEQLQVHVSAVSDFEGEPGNAAFTQQVHDGYQAAGSAGLTGIMGDVADKINANSETQAYNATAIAEKQAYINDNTLLTNAAPDSDTETTASRAETLLNKIKFAIQETDPAHTGDYSDSATDGTGAKRNNAEDAEIYLNGVKYTSGSNNITINGLTITALQKTDSDLTITTQTDVQGVYDTIKDFFKDYNALMKEMDEKYNALSAKGYEPLTDDEKEAMTDKQVEKWEDKIKDSILRRDDTLSSVMSMMSTAMSKGFTLSDGKSYSLASFGIKTQGYLAAADHEGSCYHIDGDKDDDITKGKTNQLMAAIQDNPDIVEEFFKNITSGLYKEVNDRMKTSTLNSVDTIYHDKTMKREYDEYTDTIKKWEEKVKNMEDSYYKKFAAMETALSKLQSSTNALSGLLGS